MLPITPHPELGQLYKVLNENLTTAITGHRWHVGRWTRRLSKPLVPCQYGYHICRAQDLIYHLGPRIHPVEIEGDYLLHRDGQEGSKVVCRRVWLGPALATWDERTARLFAADLAEHVLPIYERQHPGDDRSRRAIEAARAFARGEIDDMAREAAREAAWDAAGEAAWDATGAAAGDAVRAAARAAAGEAAWDAVRAAAWDATGAAAGAAAGTVARAATRAAAGAAAGDAVRAAAWDATGDAVRAAARAWQTTRLLQYFSGELT